MKNWQPVDIIIIILTLLTCFILMMASIRPLISENEIDLDTTKILAGTLGSLISIISMYVGAKIQQRNTQKNSKEQKLS